MRGTVPGLPTPHPLRELLPAFLQEDEFAVRWVAGFDDALAPVVATLDCLDAYVDPRLAPDDFPAWLAGWVGALHDESWPAERRRRAVAEAVTLHRSRGTVAGLRAQLELATGGAVEVHGAGEVRWSRDPGAPAPDEPPGLRVVIHLPDGDAAISEAAAHAIVEAAKPAHLPHTVEVVSS